MLWDVQTLPTCSPIPVIKTTKQSQGRGSETCPSKWTSHPRTREARVACGVAREARGLFVSLPSFWIQDSYPCLHLHGLPKGKERTCRLARLLIFFLRSFCMSIGLHLYSYGWIDKSPTKIGTAFDNGNFGGCTCRCSSNWTMDIYRLDSHERSIFIVSMSLQLSSFHIYWWTPVSIDIWWKV